jgi:hypothetical protein
MPGESISGDRAVVRSLLDGGTLIAVLDAPATGRRRAEAAEAGAPSSSAARRLPRCACSGRATTVCAARAAAP